MNRLIYGQGNVLGEIKPIEKSKLVVHKKPITNRSLSLKFTVKKVKGLRIYRGYETENEKPIVEVSVLDSAEGAGRFHHWAIENKIKIESFKHLDNGYHV